MTLTRRFYRAGAWVFAGLAVVPGYYAVTLRWMPHVDFDIVGFLWILQNFPRLVAWVLAFGFTAGAIYCGVRSVTA